MRALDELIASNQGNALAQMAQEPSVSRRFAGSLRDIPTSAWRHAAQYGVAGLMAVGVVLAATPLEAHADDVAPIYQPQPVQQQYQASQPSQGSSGLGTVAATVGGGAGGALVGHLFGNGTGKTIATATGAVAGALLGNSLVNSTNQPVYATAQTGTYGPNNPNPYPEQVPQPAAHTGSTINLGTGIGAVAGGFLAHTVGGGRGNIIATAVGAVAGALGGTALENAMTAPRGNDYARNQHVQDEAGACFQQWNGRLAPSQTLTSNPQADQAMRQSVGKLGEAFDEYTNEAARYRQSRENARWSVDATEQMGQRNMLNEESQAMVNAEKKYVYYRGTFMEKCNMAAERGYDVRNYAQAQQLLGLDTGGYTYKNPNPAVTAQYGVARRPGY